MLNVENKQEEEIVASNDNHNNGTEVLLITANVGSLFEDPERLLKTWLSEFLLTVAQLKPEFIALHLQEVGGKTYEKSLEHVHEFIKQLCEANELCEYSCIRIFMDEDFKSAEHFTALGNLYFNRTTLRPVKIWNFLTHNWEIAQDKSIYSGNIEAIATKEKSKFPQHFFPECKWSRKGFMRTRWEIRGTIIDLVNIHLFHDASNLVACEEFPSVYCKTRRRALVHTLERFHLDSKNGLVPFFIFGDFNFRCDTQGVIKELGENLTAHRIHNIKHDSTKVHYRNLEGNNVLTIGKKEFVHADHQLKFKEPWLKKYDRELDDLKEILAEYPIMFPPTYPYEEDPEMPTDYMSTRCPSWCDRILMSLMAKEIIDNSSDIKNVNNKNPYSVIGRNVCMGDHKPIYLYINLKPNQGIYRCCKCYRNFANDNKSTSHISPASSANNNCSISYCPYNSRAYNEALTECYKLSHIKTCLNTNLYSESTCLCEKQNLPVNNELPPTQSSHPQVSINIFDSDNINVCMCSQIAENAIDNTDSPICAGCHNLIKKQHLNHRCTLISKRLMLANDIIVNRIDTHYLNTSFDDRQRQDPYTPESAESHSPCPELSSTTTTTSSKSRSPFDKQSESEDQIKLCDTSPLQPKEHSNEYRHELKNADFHETIEKQRRGFVTPGQLKSRLEDLQRSSVQNIDNINDDADDGDVDNVDKSCQPNKHKSSCLSRCCKIS